MSDLVELARRYVSLSDQLESVRGEIAKAVLNGSGGEPARPTQPARRALGGKVQSQESPSKPNHLEAAKGSRGGDSHSTGRGSGRKKWPRLATEMHSKQSTMSERLRRLKERHLIERSGEGWAVVASA